MSGAQSIGNRIAVWISLALVLLLVMLSLSHGFFWDTIQLGSAHATFYYSRDFATLLLPDAIDSGHIPAFGMYLSLCWKLFGRNLAVSHLAMLPFALGIVWQLFALCKRFVPERFAGIAMLLVLSDATLLAQLTLVSPDVALVFFFLLSLNAIFANRKALICIGITCLFLVSMRGMMVSICLFAPDCYCNVGFGNRKWKLFVKRCSLYTAALAVFIGYNSYHFIQKGWFGVHKDSPWAQCFKPIDSFKQLLFNLGLYGWRLLDFGRIGIWIVLAVLLLRYKKRLFNADRKPLLLFALALAIILPLNMLWAKGLIAHRYFMPVYLIFGLVCAALLFAEPVAAKFKYALSLVWLTTALTGNLWIYPPQIAQGWDSSLAHWPYYGLRTAMLAYLDEQNVPISEVTSFFPNAAAFDLVDLNDDARSFKNFDANSRYVISSNIYNLPDATRSRLLSSYVEVKRFERLGIFVCLLEKR